MRGTRGATRSSGQRLLYPPPSLDLRFAETKSLTDWISGQDLITFTRASSGTVVNAAGTLETVASNLPRLTHNPLTGESLGLLVEEQRTNLLLRSGDLNDSSWQKSDATIASNVVLAPDGTLTGDKLAENTNTSTHIAFQGSASLSAGVTVCASIFLKAGERTFASLGTPSGGVGTGINLLTGELVNVSVPGWANATTRGAVPVGNGWYRVYFVFTTTGNNSLFDALRVFTNNGSTTFYAGDGTSGIYLWGAQLEAGASPTSYIPTTTAAATRSADVASITGTNFSSWYRQDEGTWFVHHDKRGILVVANNNSFNERNPQMGVGANLVHDFYSITGGVIQANNIGASRVMGIADRVAYAVKANDFIGAVNGVLTGADTSGSVSSSVTQLNIGAFHNSVGSDIGTIRRLTYWPQRLPDTTLLSLTR